MDNRIEDLISRVRGAFERAAASGEEDALEGKVASVLEEQTSLNVKKLVASSCLETKCREALKKAGAPNSYLDKDIGAAVTKAVEEVADKRGSEGKSSALVEALQRKEWLENFLEEFTDMNALVLKKISGK